MHSYKLNVRLNSLYLERTFGNLDSLFKKKECRVGDRVFIQQLKAKNLVELLREVQSIFATCYCKRFGLKQSNTDKVWKLSDLGNCCTCSFKYDDNRPIIVYDVECEPIPKRKCDND